MHKTPIFCYFFWSVLANSQLSQFDAKYFHKMPINQYNQNEKNSWNLLDEIFALKNVLKNKNIAMVGSGVWGLESEVPASLIKPFLGRDIFAKIVRHGQ